MARDPVRAPDISEAERLIMEIVWATPEGATVSGIRAGLPTGAWADSTLRTLIHRLTRKSVLVSERQATGGVIYRATLTREAYVAAQAGGLVDRLFGGQVASLVAHLVRSRSLTADERDRLRRLVAQLDAGDED
ncbi:MAG: BlaI/MecI/CopY family transcriptional regulator [Phenylobacterium sp.]|nr:BlaI/MecI/CopY family transcriptional regulator [Phenylobacterium sp.]